MATSDLYKIQQLATRLGDEKFEIEGKIKELAKQMLELKRQANSLKDGISYLERIETNLIKKEERKSADIRKKTKSRHSK